MKHARRLLRLESFLLRRPEPRLSEAELFGRFLDEMLERLPAEQRAVFDAWAGSGDDAEPPDGWSWAIRHVCRVALSSAEDPASPLWRERRGVVAADVVRLRRAEAQAPYLKAWMACGGNDPLCVAGVIAAYERSGLEREIGPLPACVYGPHLERF